MRPPPGRTRSPAGSPTGARREPGGSPGGASGGLERAEGEYRAARRGRYRLSHATGGTRRRVEHGAHARRRCASRWPAAPRFLAQGGPVPGRAPGPGQHAVVGRREAADRGGGRRAADRRGHRRRGLHRLRHLRHPGCGQRRGRARQDPGADRRPHPGAVRRERGQAHLPRRPPLVRLVIGAAAGRRHRRRLARDRGRPGRGSRGRGVAAARSRTAHQGLVHRRPAAGGRGAGAAPARAGADRQAGGRAAPRRRGRSRGRHVQDLQAAGADRRGGAVERGVLRQAVPQAQRHRAVGGAAGVDEPGRAGPAARRVRGAGRADAGRRDRRRRGDGPDGPQPAPDLPVGAARGRHTQAPRRARRPGHPHVS